MLLIFCIAASMPSLPTRERGLKLYTDILHSFAHKSLPTRERGLKLRNQKMKIFLAGSLPTRERGLKSFRPGDHGENLKPSLPTRERGLKCFNSSAICHVDSRSPRGSVD